MHYSVMHLITVLVLIPSNGMDGVLEDANRLHACWAGSKYSNMW
jgi:hypothetical protein